MIPVNDRDEVSADLWQEYRDYAPGATEAGLREFFLSLVKVRDERGELSPEMVVLHKPCRFWINARGGVSCGRERL